jgi:antirestriction protein
MKTVELKIRVRIHSTTVVPECKANADFTFETGNDFDDFLEECKDKLVEELQELNEALNGEEENFKELQDAISDEEYGISFEVENWGEVEEYENLQDIDILQEIAEESDLESYDFDIINAGVECGIDISNIAEAYNGEADSDEDFAENLANELGYIDNNTSWPHSCIDWKLAARELMWDYTESNGYYFRNL